MNEELMKQAFFKIKNIVFIAIAILTIVTGFIFLAQGPVDGFKSLTIAPILLTLGYVVLMPIAIMYGKGKVEQAEGD